MSRQVRTQDRSLLDRNFLEESRGPFLSLPLLALTALGTLSSSHSCTFQQLHLALGLQEMSAFRSPHSAESSSGTCGKKHTHTRTQYEAKHNSCTRVSHRPLPNESFVQLLNLVAQHCPPTIKLPKADCNQNCHSQDVVLQPSLAALASPAAQ